MMRAVLAAALICVANSAGADTLVAARMIPAKTVLEPGDLAVTSDTEPGALRDPIDAIGLETRVVLYPGRPVRHADLGPAALVERNALVVILFSQGGLTIATEGRALDRAAAGDRLRVMNLASRTTVTGNMGEDGIVRVGPNTARIGDP
jgi:flagella basal body P-ring formation protein FlgA